MFDKIKAWIYKHEPRDVVAGAIAVVFIVLALATVFTNGS